MNVIKKSLEIIAPMALYWMIHYLVLFAAVYLYMTCTAGKNILSESVGADQLAESAAVMLDEHALLFMGIAAVIVLPILSRMFRKEWLKRRYIIKTEERGYEKYLFTIMISIGFTLAFNLFFNAVSFFNYAVDYKDIASQLYSEPLIVQIIVIGILMPIVEELIFRGIIFEKLRNISHEKFSILLTSLIFGLYHGNFFQGCYAFIFSIFMLYVYKKVGTFAAPVLFHIVSNLSCLVLEQLTAFSTMEYSIGIVGSAVIALIGVFRMRHAHYYTRVNMEQWENLVSDEEL